MPQNKGYTYRLGWRIKNESQQIKQQALMFTVTGSEASEFSHPSGRLTERSNKDRHNGEKGLKRLEKKLSKKFNQRSYKYIKADQFEMG